MNRRDTLAGMTLQSMMWNPKEYMGVDKIKTAVDLADKLCNELDGKHNEWEQSFRNEEAMLGKMHATKYETLQCKMGDAKFQLNVPVELHNFLDSLNSNTRKLMFSILSENYDHDVREWKYSKS